MLVSRFIAGRSIAERALDVLMGSGIVDCFLAECFLEVLFRSIAERSIVEAVSRYLAERFIVECRLEALKASVLRGALSWRWPSTSSCRASWR